MLGPSPTTLARAASGSSSIGGGGGGGGGEGGGGGAGGVGGESGERETGVSSEQGIVPRAMAELLSAKRAAHQRGEALAIVCTYLQIYNERVLDLLAPDALPKPPATTTSSSSSSSTPRARPDAGLEIRSSVAGAQVVGVVTSTGTISTDNKLPLITSLLQTPPNKLPLINSPIFPPHEPTHFFFPHAFATPASRR